MKIELCRGQAFLVIEALGMLLNKCTEADEPVCLGIIQAISDADKEERAAQLEDKKAA